MTLYTKTNIFILRDFQGKYLTNMFFWVAIFFIWQICSQQIYNRFISSGMVKPKSNNWRESSSFFVHLFPRKKITPSFFLWHPPPPEEMEGTLKKKPNKTPTQTAVESLPIFVSNNSLIFQCPLCLEPVAPSCQYISYQ